jgi:uncharacterized membrane protein
MHPEESVAILTSARAVGDARARRSLLTRLSVAITALAIALVGLAPAAVSAAPSFRVWSPFPGVLVAPGNKVSFNVNITTPAPERVDLALTGVPQGWTATLHGGGYLVDAAQTDGTDTPTTVRLDVTIPANATGTTTLTLTAKAGSETRTLPLTIRVEASATGDVSLTSDFPSLRGAAGQTYTFNLTLTNDTEEDLTYAANAQGPDGWTVATKLTGQTQAASAVVKASATSSVTVTATPPTDVAAGKYPIHVVATAGSRQIPVDLEVEVTGSYDLKLSTPDGRLNGHGSAGSNTDLNLTVANNGTSAIPNVALSATPPTGWKITFEPATIASLGANQTQNVVAHVVPSGDAVAGDYDITFNAKGEQSTNSTIDIRWTVETSLQWAIVGLALIVAVIAGLAWVFQRYGRR